MNPTTQDSLPAALGEPEPSRLARWRSRVGYQGLSLGIVCGAAVLLLMLGDLATREQIAASRQQDQLAMLRQVLPDALYDNDPLGEAFTLEDARLGQVQVYPASNSGELTALVFQISPIGWAGPITLLVSVERGGAILGVRVLGHKETPGLADKIEVARSDWITRFDGLSLANTPLPAWGVKKDGGQFDQFAGATITPRAIVRAVLQTLQVQQEQGDAFAEKIQEARP
ncbi:electron transport complex subunit RsxG [Stutzerimonas kirkiae]|uniref:Ion-translocating oxidoreductase complex subunit G n=1 Tax=Stutzerimonas kirkiae TaxID=2211392 RepID=A0A4Q9RCB2_9GAMM|nr:electron transport complex subunit RsxG [Stutzerimonas kirkiae]TBU98809.1 electron transport complex subunit RsxG [Stutzerimonas kirkiae]TBV03903.1 electron transport complex subunit RsxG [Stutzerimonas kirkiae]TBV09683.1 electron transport complex subunit RsxG [Stutzerimonas kirkiae]TBV16783.1 electron transport complex subunit RsxG [Stutzerimonas kirkiae]